MRGWVFLLLLAGRALAGQQQLGYKLLGSAGIDAGVQSMPGLFVIDRVLDYSAGELRDRQGNVVPIDGLDIHAIGNGLGAAYTMKARGAPYLSFAFAVPVARIQVNSDEPAASINGYGFGDVFVQPVKAGWRARRFDVVGAYMLYIPTGRFEPRSGRGPGSGYWTNQVSAGGALFADSARTMRASALASLEVNSRKRGIDIRRGDMFQVQGGAGATVKKIVTIGVAGFALWQVTPDRGTELPPKLRGLRSRTYGLGPEVNVMIPRWKTRAEFRVEEEFAVTSRPRGRVIAVGLSWLAWAPRQRRP